MDDKIKAFREYRARMNEKILASDETFRCAEHTAYSAAGKTGYDTQFLEIYDSSAPECDFIHPDFDDSGWSFATVNLKDDHILVKQISKQLVFEDITPAVIQKRENTQTSRKSRNKEGVF